MKRLTQLTLVTALLATSGLAAGCEAERSVLVTSYPQLAPILGGRPQPSPFKLKSGNIRGFVYGAEGPKQPIPLAFVTTGSISEFTGNPDESQVVEEEEDDGQTITVSHEFEDGTVALAERRKRKKPIETEDDDPFKEKYVYLRKGEFFLEDVPEGIATLRTSFGNVESAQNQVLVHPNVTVTDVSLNLYIPVPVANEDQTTPKVIEWTGSKPSTGIILDATTKQTTLPDGQIILEPDVSYKPDPPDVAIELKAPPGSGGTVITAINILYEARYANRVERKELPPIAISPIVVSAAQATSFGPPTIMTIPVGSKTLSSYFSDPDPNNQPGLVMAYITFTGEDGFLVQAKDLEALTCAVAMRAL